MMAVRGIIIRRFMMILPILTVLFFSARCTSPVGEITATLKVVSITSTQTPSLTLQTVTPVLLTVLPTSTTSMIPTETPTPIPTPSLVPLEGQGGGIILIDLYDYLGFEGGTRDLYALNADETGFRRLLENRWHDYEPAWSPDGAQIAFTTDRNGNLDIYLLNWSDALQGEGDDAVRQLTFSEGDDSHPEWSPDGSRIVFQSNRGGDWDLYTIDAAGGDALPLTTNDANDRMPDWSPDGRWIAFESSCDGDYEIYLMDVTDGTLVQLTDNQVSDYGPAWSPDGAQIAYSAIIGEGLEIFVIDILPDTTGPANPPRQLTSHHSSAFMPKWSPDGKQIIYLLHNAGAEPGTHSMNADGSNQRYMQAAAGSYSHDWGNLP